MRKPIVAGQFYEANFGSLNKQIENCFFHKFGPGDLPTRRKDNIVYGIISPHAGYAYSGPCQAWAYKEIAESKKPNTFVMIGVNHSGQGANFSVSLDDWETPLGIVKADKGFARELINKCDFVKEDKGAHENEHSIEVQLPFLQYVNKDYLNSIKFVPIVISNYNLEMCKKLAEAIVNIDKNVIIIASSDFTHYGYNYGYTPFIRDKKENLYKLDGGAIEQITALNSEDFLTYKKQMRTTICGTGAISVLIECVKMLGAKKGNLLNYYTSGDITESYKNAVGYAAIVFR